MVISYLEKLQKDYLQEKSTVDQECERLQLCLKEIGELVKLLEETSDPSYESFTPRNVNMKNKLKISELLNEQEKVQQTLDQRETYRDACEARLKEVSDVISIARKNQTEYQKRDSEFELYRDSFLKERKDKQFIIKTLEDSILQNIKRLIYKTELCTKLAEVDSNRCKLELNELSKTLYEISDVISTISFHEE